MKSKIQLGNDSRDYYIDVLKCIGMLLVMYAHIVVVGSYSTTIPGVISGTLSQPILSHCGLLKIEKFFDNFHVQSGVVGVCIFFIISGLFIPRMQEKYNSGDFSLLWLKQAYRIIPTVVLCVLINGILVWKLQGIKFEFKDYITTAVYGSDILFKSTQSTLGGLNWYLSVLSLAYVISCIVKKYTLSSLYVVYTILLILVLIPKLTIGIPVNTVFSKLAYWGAHAGCIYIGVAYSLTKDSKLIYKCLRLLIFLVLTIFIKTTYNYLYDIKDTYSNWQTYITVICIFIIFKLLYYLFKRIRFAKLKNIIKFTISEISKLFLSVYLVHLHFGTLTTYYLRSYGVNTYLCVIAAFVVSFVVAYLLFLLVTYFYRYVGKTVNFGVSKKLLG